MERSSSNPVTLIVHGPDEATEIFLVGGSLDCIASGVGRLVARVPPGLYKIRYRSGATQADTLLDVPDGSKPLTIYADPVRFRSAAPITDTETANREQASGAKHGSRNAHLHIGQGSQLFLFAREVSRELPWPECDISLHDLHGIRLAGIEAGFTNLDLRIAGINISLDPGTYSVRVNNATLGSYEMYVTASPDWQTQLFFCFEDFWSKGERVRAPSIRQASLLMARPDHGFNPDSPTSRTSELARLALAQGRDIVGSTLMDRLTYGKFEDPLLGIVAAHLLLRRPRRDLTLLRKICSNLRNLLGDHPDVQALMLATCPPASRSITKFIVPPSFRQSWSEIVKVTRRRASLVPADGVVAQIAANVVRAGIWLTRRVPDIDRPIESGTTTSIAGASRLAESLFAQSPDTLVDIAKSARARSQPLSSMEKTVLGTALSFSRSRNSLDFVESQFGTPLGRDNKRLLTSINAPSYAVANAVVSLASKLDIKR
jgi:hypothetical protein